MFDFIVEMFFDFVHSPRWASRERAMCVPPSTKGVWVEPIIPLGNAATRACTELSSQFAELC